MASPTATFTTARPHRSSTLILNYRAWLITNIFTDSRFSSSASVTQNRDNHWNGGIFEYPAPGDSVIYPDYRIQITDGASGATNGDLTFRDMQIAGPCNLALVAVGGGADPPGCNIIFENVEFVTNSSTLTLVTAASGAVRYRGSTRTQSGSYLGLRDGTTVSGTATVTFDGDTSGLLLDADRRFGTNATVSWYPNGGAIAYGPTKSALAITGGSPGFGAYVTYSGQGGNATVGNYAQQYRLVRARLYVTDLVNAWALYAVQTTSLYSTLLTELPAGLTDIVYEMNGSTEVGVGIYQLGIGDGSINLRFIDVQHEAC